MKNMLLFEPAFKPLFRYVSKTAALMFLVVFILIVPTSSFSADYEKPIPLKAEDILSEKLLSSDYHQVEGEVENDGLFNTYKVRSPFGNFTIETTLRLKQLVHELRVVAEMRKVETDDTVVASLQESGKNVAKGIGNIFSDPQGAFDGAVSGAQNIFGRAKETVGKRKLSDAEDSRFEQLVGISKSKGEIATQFGVSVYSTNPVLQEELDRLGRADFAGGIGVGVLQSVIPGVGGMLLTVSGSTRLLNEVINTTAASELWVRNKKALLELKISEGTVEYFLNNPAYSPAQKTIITEALKKLRDVEGSNILLEIGLQASTLRMANVVTVFAGMVASYHKEVAPLKSLKPVARFAYGIDKKGKTILLLPTDYLIWSERLYEVTKDLQSRSGEIWTLGNLSEIATRELESHGWSIKTKVGEKLIQ